MDLVKELFVEAEKKEELKQAAAKMHKIEIDTLSMQWLQVISALRWNVHLTIQSLMSRE